MATSSKLGKRKERDDEKPAMIEVRVVLENHWATKSTQIPASSASTTILKFFEQVQGVLPVASRPTPAAQKLAAPKLLLQETSNASPSLRGSKYFEVVWTSNVDSFHNWYTRNALQGNTSMLRCEVHLRTFACAEREARLELEESKKLWFDSRYVPFKASKKPEGSHKWEVSPVDTDEYDWDIEAIEDAPSTEEWFPNRVSNKGGVVKKEAATAKKPKVAIEEGTAPVKKEKSSKDGGEGVEKAIGVEEEEKILWDYSSEEEKRMIEQWRGEEKRARERRERTEKRLGWKF